eukprot:COSAG01_NODE_121_length_25291_cov_10.011670_4_plen_202_part_00
MPQEGWRLGHALSQGSRAAVGDLHTDQQPRSAAFPSCAVSRGEIDFRLRAGGTSPTSSTRLGFRIHVGVESGQPVRTAGAWSAALDACCWWRLPACWRRAAAGVPVAACRQLLQLLVWRASSATYYQLCKMAGPWVRLGARHAKPYCIAAAAGAAFLVADEWLTSLFYHELPPPPSACSDHDDDGAAAAAAAAHRPRQLRA